MSASSIADRAARRHSLRSMRRSLILFARAPRLGEVKTRLAVAVGDREALAIYRELGSRAVQASTMPDCTRVVAFTPPDAEADMRAWLGEDLHYVPQGSGDLGQRMQRAIANRIAEGDERVVVVGSDCPTLTPEVIESAFAALSRADVVLGPAADGGYYLVGVNGDHPAIFQEVPWSSAETLAVTLRRAGDAGLRTALLAEHADIDTYDDLCRWRAVLHERANAP